MFIFLEGDLMFPPDVYIARRELLSKQVKTGLILLPGNDESPMNYSDNAYLFRQDSSFLYFFGLDRPSLAGVIDIDRGQHLVFGDDLTVEHIIWMGPQPTLAQKCEKVGITHTAALKKLPDLLDQALRQGRPVHFLPQYRPENIHKIQQLLNICPEELPARVSPELIDAVIQQRSVKSAPEIEQIEIALDIAHQMHTTAMKMTQPGIYEREVAGTIEGLALARDSRMPFPVIFSVNGQTLHNHYHGNLMQKGDIVVNDSGAESPLHYASDITRTIPVSGKFTEKQKEIYNLVLAMQQQAIDAIKPGLQFRQIHLLASRVLTQGLQELNLMTGNLDQAVDAGAHALFFPHGLGHMMGLDVHDMESLGEERVGYDDTIQRSTQFGLRSLRLGRKLEAGFVITVEPGIYFIPELIDQWKAQKICTEFINYNQVEKYLDFGGIRIEDDVLVTKTARRILGIPIPKTIDHLEQTCSQPFSTC